MCLWLFIAESPFYTQYIKCYLSCFLVSYIYVFEKITIKNNTTRCVIGMPPSSPLVCHHTSNRTTVSCKVWRHRLMLLQRLEVG